MLTLYRPGDGPWHRLPAGPKMALVMLVVLGVCLLPMSWAGATVGVVVCLCCYALPAMGMRELARQVYVLRWVIVVMAAWQLLFLGPEAAVANTVRVSAAGVLSALIALTTPAEELLDALERAMKPLRWLRFDPQRAALLIILTFTMLPVLARLAHEVRQAQAARGAGPSLRHFAPTLLVVALKHADSLGDALTARGVR